MGYTRYGLTVVEGASVPELDGDAQYAALCRGEPATWCDAEKDLRALSARHPGVLFTLDGEGEEVGDRWRTYFCGGLAQAERMPAWEPPPFDPAKLR